MKEENLFSNNKVSDDFLSQLLQYREQLDNTSFVKNLLNKANRVQLKRELLISIFGALGLFGFLFTNPISISFNHFDFGFLPSAINSLSAITLLGITAISFWLMLEDS